MLIHFSALMPLQNNVKKARQFNLNQMKSPPKYPLANIKHLHPDTAPLRPAEDGITPVKPSLSHPEMGMAFRCFAGSKVTNLNLYRRAKVS